MSLHDIWGRMHRFHSTIVSGQLLEYSNTVEKACSSEPTGDLGNLNRLRFFVQTFSSNQGASQDCRCGSKDECLLFLVKSFVAYGGRDCVLNLLLGNGDDPLWVLLGNSPLQQTLHQWCFHLLWLLANIPPPTFSTCWGGSLIKATVDSYQTRKVGLARHEIEFVVVVDGNMSQNIIRKKSAALIAFQEQIREWLKGIVEIPEVGKAKGKATEVADSLKANANAMFQIFSVPYNFHNLLNVQKARELFLEFLEIDTRHMQTSKTDFIQWVSEYEGRFRPRRNLPCTILPFLGNLLTGDVSLGPTNLISDVFSITCDEAPGFSISKIQEGWLLPHLLAAIPSVPRDMAVMFLLELSEFFNRSPASRTKLLLDEKLVIGLLPVLFDQQEDEKRNVANQSTDYVMPFQLAVDIVADAHVHDILTRASTKYANEQALLKSSVEGLLASSVFQIGSYHGRDGILPWSTRNVEIVHALASGVAVRLNAVVPKFQHMLEHPAWENTLEILNVFRNLTFCPITPFAASNDPLETQILRNLLNKGAVSPQVKNINECQVLLSEHCVATIRILAQGLKLFELMPVDKSPAEVTRLKNTKGAGLAYSAYFRDCLGCFRTVRERSPDDRTKMIAQFFTTYVFDRTYSTEKEARLKLIEDTEARRRLTLMERKEGAVKSEPEDKKQHIRDLETLAGGVTMWLIPKKGKVQQCCVFLQRRGNTKAFRKFADSFVLTLELGHEKSSFVLYEQVTLDVGANDPMLLHKTGLDYAAHMALSLWKDKHCRHLVCTSMDDFECFTRALAVIRGQHLGMGTSAVPQVGDLQSVELDPREEEALANVNINSIKFYQSILLTYRFMHTPITAAMAEFSNRIQHACAASPEAESLGEFNLLKFLVSTFQNKTGCEQFQVPCQTCGKGDKAHPGELKCGKYLPVHGAKRCACGKPDNFPHPWTLDSFQDCRCGSQEPCTLFAIKCFLAHGGKDLLFRKLHDSNTEPYVLRWCIQLLWLFSTIPYSSFLRCWGGTYVKVKVETNGKNQATLGTLLNAQELIFTVDVNLTQLTLRRKFPQIIAFHEQLRELLKGIVQIPEPPRNGKGNTTDMADVLLEIVSATFDILKIPANFHKLIRIERARNLFYEFLEIESHLLMVTKHQFRQCVVEVSQSHLAKRNMPRPIFHFLARTMTGDSLRAPADIVEDVNAIVSDESDFSIPKVQDNWLLSLILSIIPATSGEVANEFLRELNHCFIRQPWWCKQILREDGFQQWFFPVLFDQYGDSRPLDTFHLAIMVLCLLHCHDVCSEARPADGSAEFTVDGLFASTIMHIGSFDGLLNGVQQVAWAKRNMEVIQALVNGIAGKLVASLSSLRFAVSSWGNLVEVLHVYRNMTWCPVFPRAGASEMIRNLVAKPGMRVPPSNMEPFRVLLSETALMSLRNLCGGLQVFDVVVDTSDVKETSQLRNIQGACAAFTNYFRECLGCLRTMKDHSVEDQAKMMGQFYTTFPFDPTYSKEAEAQVTVMNEFESRKRRANPIVGVKAEDQGRKMHILDLEALSLGVTVWKVPINKRDKVQHCILFLRQEDDATKARKRYVLTYQTPRKKATFVLFDKATIEIGTSVENLTKNGLEYLAPVGLTLWKNMKRRDLVCPAIEDFERVSRVLKVLVEQRLGSDPLAPSEAQLEERASQADASGDLHGVIGLVHSTFPTSLSASLLEYSNKVNTACVKLPTSVGLDLGDMNRLRFLAHVFHAKTGCDQFTLRCQHCGKAEKMHAPKMKCSKYVPSTEALCVCGRSAPSHPWTQDSLQDCHCDSREICTLFLIKCFVAHGGKDVVFRMLLDVEKPSFLHRWCLHVLWLLSTIPSASFMSCRGGTLVKVSVEAPTTTRVGLKQETEFLLIADANSVQSMIRKKMSALISFQDQLRDLLKGTLELPETPKKSNAETADLVKASAGTMFQMLSLPVNFQKLASVERARELFLDFLEIDTRPLQVTQSDFTQCISDFVLRFQPRRNLRRSVIDFLVSVMVGERLQVDIDILDKPTMVSASRATNAPFSIPKVHESWVLSLILSALPAAPDDTAVAFLTELNAFFNRQADLRARLLLEDKLVLWLLPILFDQDEEDRKESKPEKKTDEVHVEEKKSDRLTTFQLAVEILSATHVHEILTQPLTKYANEQIWLKSSVEGLFAITVTEMGDYGVPWSKRNLEIVQAVMNSMVVKLIEAVPKFQHSMKSSAWENLIEVLNVFRNMTWCVVFPSTASSETSQMQVIRNLLNKGMSPNRSVTESKILVSEHTVALLRHFLQALNVFELGAEQSGDTNRNKMVKGATLALASYFRDCLGCFQTMRGRRAEEQNRTMGQFFSSYTFDRTYSKDEETRLKVIDDTESRRRMTLMERAGNLGNGASSGDPEDKKQHIRDLEALAAGVTAWNIPKKGKIQQCYIFLKYDKPGSTPGGKSPKSVAASLGGFSLVIEIQRKRTAFLYPKQATVELGVEPSLLAKTGFEHGRELGLTMWQGKSSSSFICTSADDWECWSRVLSTLKANRFPDAPLSISTASRSSHNAGSPSLRSVMPAFDLPKLDKLPSSPLQTKVTPEVVHTRSRSMAGATSAFPHSVSYVAPPPAAVGARINPQLQAAASVNRIPLPEPPPEDA